MDWAEAALRDSEIARAIFQENLFLMQKIAELCQSRIPVTIMSFSARQHHGREWAGVDAYSLSSFTIFPELIKIIREEFNISEELLRFDPILLEDTWLGREPGSTLLGIDSETPCPCYAPSESSILLKNTEAKLHLVYHLIQHIYERYRDNQMRADPKFALEFFDDKWEILSNITEALSSESAMQLIPNNMTLEFICYPGRSDDGLERLAKYQGESRSGPQVSIKNIKFFLEGHSQPPTPHELEKESFDHSLAWQKALTLAMNGNKT